MSEDAQRWLYSFFAAVVLMAVLVGGIFALLGST